MASGKSNYLRNAIVDLVLGQGTFVPPATVYVALSTAAWSASTTGTTLAASEPSGSGYERVAVTNTSSVWPAAAAGSKSNSSAIAFPNALGSWGAIQSFYVVDAATGGNVLYGGDLYTARTIQAGDLATFGAGQLNVTET